MFYQKRKLLTFNGVYFSKVANVQRLDLLEADNG
jgi:hypothetical protein